MLWKAKYALTITFLLASLNSRPVQAGELLLLGGAEGGVAKSYNYYSYLGALAPLVGGNLGTGFQQRYWVDLYGYNYPAGSSTVDVSAFGLEAALGYHKQGEHVSAGGFAGVRYSNATLSPDDKGNRSRGSNINLKLQAEAEGRISDDFTLGAMGSYIVGLDSYWTRGRVSYKLHDQLNTGPEIVTQGDPSYYAWKWGWFVTGFEPMPRSNLGFKAGLMTTKSKDTGGYFGVDFARLF